MRFKSVLKRIALISLVFLALLFSFISFGQGFRLASDSFQTASDVAREGGDALAASSQAQFELLQLEQSIASGVIRPDTTVATGALAEWHRAMEVFLRACDQAGFTGIYIDELRDTTTKCVSVVQRISPGFPGNDLQVSIDERTVLHAARIRHKLGVVYDQIEPVRAAILTATSIDMDKASTAISRGRSGIIVAVITLIGVMLLYILEMFDDIVQPGPLEGNLQNLSSTDEFQSRMELLSTRKNVDCAEHPWQLELKEITSERKTHIAFRAVARRDGEEVLLWGKQYKLTAQYKALQRLLLPSYGWATWNILCLMHRHGINSPVPVMYYKIRMNRCLVGSIVLAEHVGKLEATKSFVRTRFCLLAPDLRQAFLEELADCIRRIHNFGIYDITIRYIHGKNLDQGKGKIKLYLCDLDKALLWQRAIPSFVRKYLKWKDNHRLLKFFEHYTTPEEHEIFKAGLNAGDAYQEPVRTASI